MSLGTDRMCLCAHAEGEHTVHGECAIHRHDGGEECGCPRFTPVTEDHVLPHCAICGRSGSGLEIHMCLTHQKPCCRICWFAGRC